MDSIPPSNIARWRDHPAFFLACPDPEFVNEFNACLLCGHASLFSTQRWYAMFRHRSPLQAHVQCNVYGIDVGLKQRNRLQTRTAICDMLVLRLMRFRGAYGVGYPQHHAMCIVSRRHFLVSKGLANRLFKEGQQLCEQQRFSEAAKIWGHAALLCHGASHAHLSNMLFEGRRDVSKYEELAFEVASAGVALGCADSKGVLSRCLVNGTGVDQDVERGLALAKESAAAGSPFGKFVLGKCYETGCGVPQNWVEAVEWLQLAAEQGHIRAQHNLGTLFKNGIGVDQDDIAAVRWITLAAAQGYVCAQYNLGVMYERGRGVSQDNAEADRWFRFAAAQGHAHAKFKIDCKGR